MSRIELYFDWNGDRVRISGAKLRTQADADELIDAITIIRRLLPGNAATEKAAGTPPAGEVLPVSPAPAPIPPETAAQTDPRPSGLSSQAGGDAVASPATSSHASGKSAGSAEPAAPTLTARVAALHGEHPDWTAGQMHKAMPGTKLDSVKGILSKLRREARGPTEVGVEAPSVPEPPSPPAPVAAFPSPGSAIITKPMVKPKGARFYLRNDAGEYLHFSATCMTASKAHAWIGDEGHLRAVRRKFEIARDLREVVVPKESRDAA